MGIPILFGRFLVREGKLSDKEIKELVQVQSEINNSFPVATLEGDFVNLDQFKKAREHQREKGVTFVESLKSLELANDDLIKEVEGKMKQNNVKLGELIVRRGIMSEDELKEVLDEFKERGKLFLK